MSILVTGGAGFIGSHTARLLAEQARALVVLDDLSTGHRDAARWGTFVEGSIADRPRVTALLRAHRIETVVHFAACAYVGESVADPRKYFRNNVVGSLALLDAVVDATQEDGLVRSIVFSSSCATYGAPLVSPMNEDHPQKPTNPYGETKLVVERALESYGRAYGLPWVALRYFNAAGAHPDGTLGEDHAPEPHLVPIAISAALGRRAFVPILGTDYPTRDGTAVRDYVHVVDLATAHAKALDYLAAGGTSGAFNLGTGRGHSVEEVVATVERLSGRSIERRASPRRIGDPAELVADATRARTALGWQPTMSSLDRIVETAMTYGRDRWNA